MLSSGRRPPALKTTAPAKGELSPEQSSHGLSGKVAGLQRSATLPSALRRLPSQTYGEAWPPGSDWRMDKGSTIPNSCLVIKSGFLVLQGLKSGKSLITHAHEITGEQTIDSPSCHNTNSHRSSISVNMPELGLHLHAANGTLENATGRWIMFSSVGSTLKQKERLAKPTQEVKAQMFKYVSRAKCVNRPNLEEGCAKNIKRRPLGSAYQEERCVKKDLLNPKGDQAAGGPSQPRHGEPL